MNIKQPVAELNRDHRQQLWHGGTEIACDAHTDRATGSGGGVGKIKVYCVITGRLVVVLFCVFSGLGLHSIMTTCWLIWIHISWLGIWYRGNGLQGPMRTQQGAPAVQLSLLICRPPLRRELHFLPERSSRRQRHAEPANLLNIYKYRSTKIFSLLSTWTHTRDIQWFYLKLLTNIILSIVWNIF